MSKNTIESATAAPRRSIFNAAACVVESLDERKLMSATYDLGININNTDAKTVGLAAPVLKELGVTTVRIWAGVGNNFNDRWFGNPLQRAIDYHNAGFDVMMIIQSDKGKVPTPANVKNWFNWALSNSALKNAVDRWQIGNEMDHDTYWKGDLKSYVNNFLKPASEALHAQGEKVVSGGPSWNPADVKEMIDDGMLNYVDYVGFHPYAETAALQKKRIDDVNDIVNGRKPLVASEWNTYVGGNNETKWQTELKKALPNIQNGFDINYYFALIRDTTSAERGRAGPAGIMTTGGAKTSFFYALKEAMGGAASGPDDGVDNTPESLPTVTKTSLYNADTNKVVIDSLTSGTTIDIAKYGTRNFSIVSTTASGTTSVKFVVDGTTTTESSAPYAAFSDKDGDYYGKVFANGSHTIKVTPYSGNNATGKAGVTRSISFTVTDSGKKPTPTPTPTTPTPTPTPTPTKPSNGPSVTKISLFNADTNKVIAGFEDLDSGDTLDLKKTGVKHIAIVASAANGTESVKMILNGKANVESLAPYAYFGDNMKGDYYNGDANVGTYTLSAQAFTKDDAKGVAGALTTLSFNIVNGTATSTPKPTTPTTTTPVPTTPVGSKPAITGYKLVDAKTGNDIAGQSVITGNKTISVKSLSTKNIAIVALTNGATTSVKFNVNGKSHIEDGAPYAVLGNTGGKFVGRTASGSLWFSGTPYTVDGAKGTVGSTLGLTIKFVA